MGLYKPKAKLETLYQENNQIFSAFELPSYVEEETSVDYISAADLAVIMLHELGEMDTLFRTAAEWIAFVTVWSGQKVHNWQREADALMAEYEPLHNYDMTEAGSDTHSVQHGKTTTRTYDTAHTKSGTEEDAGSASSTPEVVQTTVTSNYGINSNNPVPAQKAVSTPEGTDSVESENTKTFDTTDADTGTVTDVESGTDKDTIAHSLTRSGNIGVTTSQQMLESEVVLRIRWTLLDLILADCKRDLFAAIW